MVCFLYIALADLLCSLAQLCSLEIQLLHAPEAALQFTWQSCGACMPAIGLSIGHLEHKRLQCWALTVNKRLQIPHKHSVLPARCLQLSPPQLWLAMCHPEP